MTIQTWFRSLFLPKCPDCGRPMERSSYGFRFECVKPHLPSNEPFVEPVVHDPDYAVSKLALVLCFVCVVIIIAVAYFGTQRDTVSVPEVSLTGAPHR